MPGEKIFETSRGNIAIAKSDGTEEARNQLPKPISTPAFCAICTPIGLHEVAVRHRAEHQIAAQPPSLGLVGFGPRSLGYGQHDREEHPAARCVAGERRRDDRIGQHDAVCKTERGTAEAAHHQQADAPAEPRLHHGLRDDEGDDNEQDAVIGEAGKGLRRRDRPGEDDGPDGNHRGREKWEGAQEHARDRGDEDREQVPGVCGEAGRQRGKPDGDRDREGRRALQQQSGRDHLDKAPAAG
jgi:hypothetical protein